MKHISFKHEECIQTVPDIESTQKCWVFPVEFLVDTEVSKAGDGICTGDATGMR